MMGKFKPREIIVVNDSDGEVEGELAFVVRESTSYVDMYEVLLLSDYHPGVSMQNIELKLASQDKIRLAELSEVEANLDVWEKANESKFEYPLWKEEGRLVLV
ncbi:MAG: hypothetical protein WCV58_00855 [Patescibacteria group bacterium]